jgi:hypothetical protein
MDDVIETFRKARADLSKAQANYDESMTAARQAAIAMRKAEGRFDEARDALLAEAAGQ